ncbi:hypothetical protein LAZ67_4000439 [Cordylochernes scorpioides]|uniref:Uncharacterized protein n=1 Tax=Cordylochernes scorpioides TaxID=51811 RepID=A0ABY6KC56_9ARAC|nr:hypothetical protein LAZ67_4000439 [Cordylochernes scorpioides]
MAPVIPVRRYNYYNRKDTEKISMVPVIPVRRYNYYNRKDTEKISMVPVILAEENFKSLQQKSKLCKSARRRTSCKSGHADRLRYCLVFRGRCPKPIGAGQDLAEDNNQESEDPFITVQRKKRRRGSAESPAAAATFL